MFDPVPSHRLPSVFEKIASLAPASLAAASATTFSAYDVVFNPATAEFSLRVQRTVATFVVGAGRGTAPAVTMYVCGASPRSEPSGPTPPVTV